MNTKILLCFLVLVAIIALSEQAGGGRKTTATTRARKSRRRKLPHHPLHATRQSQTLLCRPIRHGHHLTRT